MKQIISILFIIGFLLSCNKENLPLAQQSSPEMSKQEKEFKSRMVLEKENVPPVLKNSLGGPEGQKHTHSDLILEFIGLENQNPAPEQWRPIDQLFRQKYSELIKNQDDELAYTLDIQLLSYRILARHLLLVPADEETTGIIIYYMDHLMRHKGVDLTILTDAALRLRGWAPPEKTRQYESYILETARTTIPAYEQRIEETRAAYEAETDATEKMWLKAQLKHYAATYRAAQQAIEALSGGN